MHCMLGEHGAVGDVIVNRNKPRGFQVKMCHWALLIILNRIKQNQCVTGPIDNLEENKTKSMCHWSY